MDQVTCSRNQEQLYQLSISVNDNLNDHHCGTLDFIPNVFIKLVAIPNREPPSCSARVSSVPSFTALSKLLVAWD